jgi:uncharacterized surface protein with fasciclin (FAS1) repeats
MGVVTQNARESTMKTLTCLLICTALLGAMPASTTPSAQNAPARDLIDTAMDVHQFDTFLKLVRVSDLTFDLKGSGPFTVFAPTDDAFGKMPDSRLQAILGDGAQLRKFVLHHVVRGNYTVAQALKKGTLIALDGTKLVLRNTNGHGTVAGAGFSIANIGASNGMMHGVDGVLSPK